MIRGVGSYGNCFGVPTVGGEVAFEPCYSQNPLVNALALGIARKEDLFFAKAKGTGNPVIYVGAKTGRDGIHGASLLASAEFTEESQQKRPNVQVGDPFMEKLLLEACLEAMKTGAVVAIQDMGAAGLTCSTCEMASRGATGIEIDLAKVPQRETGMSPYEIMLSESQERMLLVAERGREQEVLAVFKKWGLDATVVGEVKDGGLLVVKDHGKVVAQIPAHPLAEEGPVYNRPIAEPKARKESEQDWFRFCRGGDGADGEFQEAAGIADDCVEAVDHRAVRHDGADEYAGGAGRERRGGGADQGDEEGIGAGDGWQWPLDFPESETGRDARGGRSGAERGGQRGAADCGDELLELWQPGEAGGDVAVFAGHRWIERGVRGAGHADYRRETSVFITRR